MADIGDWLYATLNAHAGTAALVATRIFPVKRPQGAQLPAITYQQVSGPRPHAFGADPGITQPGIQITCWGRSYSEARALGKQVKAALDRKTGTLAGVTVHGCFREGDIDAYADGPQHFRTDIDYTISYQEG